ncbi:GTP-binding protein [Neobacillus sp. PS3-40]|jgi:G3E family GTPase|uniref:CobW family GTP-binding protein n=1 Tax=Neobacillus sp. PS3-40 TaxID=3070679 RepID=UPI0027DF746B|nr:GTP-binding protein [Neobacillus sp. PS3-40]WML44989.1 GTP-binding protein [Neobacillus sp. PS3-40]
MSKTEILILSGFLGSGKTSLLKRLLEDERRIGRKVAVMMNELGNVSIDSDVVEDDVALKELLGGCVCCSIQDELEAQLQGLLLAEKPDVIYLETTGAAHPVEVLDAILSPLFADRLTIKGIITTVDGVRWRDRKLLSPQLQQLIIEQVRHADFIIINKTNELTEAEQAMISFEVQSLNANAQCLLTTFSRVAIEQLRKLTVSSEQTAKKHGSHTKVNLTTFVYQFQSSISPIEFENFLKSLPDTIYRIKGYIKFGQSDLPTLFQFSYGMPLYMKEYMNMPLNLVFIGEGIDWKTIESQLNILEK